MHQRFHKIISICRSSSSAASSYRITIRKSLSTTATGFQTSARQKILSAALPHVHAHGWTEQALAQGVLTSSLPPSYIGIIQDKKSDLIHYFMEDCNVRLSKAMTDNPDLEKMTHAQIIEWGIRTRLEMNTAFVRSKRWHEGMALGAMPVNMLETANHLEKMVGIIADAMIQKSKPSTINETQSLSTVERGAIGAAYVATELHLLSDESEGYQDTWRFLNQRVKELELAAQSDFSAIPSSDMMVAGAAVATSLGGAVVSLVAPAAASGMQAIAGNVMPQLMNFVQPPNLDSTVGTKAQDYDLSDLPPFETDNTNKANVK